MTRRNPWLIPYQRLAARHGPQHWWPGETPFEVMVGAVLTQNTAWTNVERAIANLKAAGLLDCAAILACPDAELAAAIRPAGYFNVKAGRLKALCRFLAERGVAAAPERLAGQAGQAELRDALLAVSGVGPETADSILLYALGLPSFVVDAYTRRAYARLGLLRGDESYAEIQTLFERHLARDVGLYNEYHALIVRLGKEHCRPRPRCPDCPLKEICRHAL
ncbi:endonuclease III domain-containing protein [Parasulfuritortus cantonensis]|uniref:Endonuclease III domain-containing protein n=1 Tax=Parasulfuritortus cantonensis TaxID=2528202 RepID=A0A4R1B6X9_9PROT|nr:endonuclease III domain-containing protein [Parasulfuritortus cantonensis]TCJ11825.1 endonuclease III domain-containing protein [Parasulfuritortus cantonensis]